MNKLRKLHPYIMKFSCYTLLFCLATAIGSSAQTYKTLVNFDITNGSTPFSALVQGTDGNFYGTTAAGGANGDGTVFKITASGALTTLYSFGGTDGANPYSGLIQGTDGNFYGTTYYGGANNDGTVFKITPSGVLTQLYSFCSQPNCADGANPMASLIQATDGDLYGTTLYGGPNICQPGCGTIFKITTSGALTTVHSFAIHDGFNPYGGVIQATDGNFYGTTEFGQGVSGLGTIFKMDAGGTLITLHSFVHSDGALPLASLLQGADGDFYGVAPCCGAYDDGTVFKITSDGTFTVLQSFDGNDGDYVNGPLVQAPNGNFYGTSDEGGAFTYYGTLFQVTPSGVITSLWSFNPYNSGYGPRTSLMQSTNGIFYGTTALGGTDPDCEVNQGCGTIFSLSLGQAPFVTTNPTSGSAGTQVAILGNDLSSTTSVTFNGIPAAFQLISASALSVTVPAGATTGFVSVTKPSGTLKSNMKFHVTQ
jgi:uncharacterized repeat protein (TIGR03803 family)